VDPRADLTTLALHTKTHAASNESKHPTSYSTPSSPHPSIPSASVALFEM
jgi:hypothetical protein